ncbi:SsrA-binding protein SmpB [Mycoplasmatota bacterium]|nr:SsrA-binding protein SmpB [Mycoplasmatota bacterium]
MPKGFGKIIAQNKKAYHDYFIEDTYEAGIVLEGTEIKSIRQGKASIKDAYAHIDSNQAYINNMHITQYDFGTKGNHEPTRTRRLLLHKKEISRLFGLQQQQGYSLIPLKLYLKDGFAKLEIALAKGKKQYDKREALKIKDSNRQIERAMKDKYRG